MRDRPLLLVVLILLSAFATEGHCQYEANDMKSSPLAPLRCAAGWRAGTERTYTVSREKLRHEAGRLVSTEQGSTQVTISVLEATEQGFVISWKLQGGAAALGTENVQALLRDSLLNYEMLLQLDAEGLLVEVLDMERTRERAQALAERTLDVLLAESTQEERRIGQQLVERIYGDPEWFSNMALQYPETFLSAYGVEVLPEGVLTIQAEERNAITGRKMRREVTTELVYVIEDSYQIDITVTPHPEDLADHMERVLKDLAKQGAGQRPKRGTFDGMRMYTTYSIVLDLDESWPKRIERVQHTHMGDEHVEERINFSTTPKPETELDELTLNYMVQQTPDDAPLYLLRSLKRSERGDMDGAMEDAEMALIIDPDAAVGYHLRGQLRAMRDDLDGALKDLDRCVAMDPEDPDYLLDRADIHMRRYLAEEALADLQRAMLLDSTGARVHVGTGDALMVLARYEEALRSYDKAIARDSSKASFHALRGSCLMQMGRDEDALSSLEHALELDPESMSALVSMGNRELGLEHWDGAIHFFDRALEVDPFDAITWNNRGYAKINSGDLEGGIADCREAFELDPFMSFALNNLGRGLHLQGALEEAEDAIRASIEMNDRNPYAYKNLGLILLDGDRQEEACAQFQEALAKGFTVRYGDAVERLVEAHCQ